MKINSDKANQKKIKEQKIQDKKNYLIDEINKSKELIEHIKTYVSPNNKPLYNIDNAFTPALYTRYSKKDVFICYIYTCHTVPYIAYFAYYYMSNMTNMLHIAFHIFHIHLHIVQYFFTYFAYTLSQSAYCMQHEKCEEHGPCTSFRHSFAYIICEPAYYTCPQNM